MSDQHEDISGFLSRWTAAEVSGDVSALERYLTDDFIGIGPLGFTLSKQDWLARYAPGRLQYDTFQLEDVQLREYSDVAAVLARQLGKGTFQGNPVPEAVRATLVLVNQSGAWLLSIIHMSFIAGTPGSPPVPGRPS
jgi:ketosteroid isomerase-like protein